MLKRIKNKWGRWATIVIIMILFCYGAQKLDQATDGPEFVTYTVVDKLQGYSYYDAKEGPINYLLLKESGGKKLTMQVSILVHHNAKIGDVLKYRNPANDSSWFVSSLFVILLAFIWVGLGKFHNSMFPNSNT